MFLFRAAFWFMIVVMLIPADAETNTPAPREMIIETFVAGQAVIADLSQFCERNPGICDTGHAAFGVFAEKAQTGARMLFRYLDANFDGNTAKDDQSTLTGGDRAPEWQGPQGDGTA